MDLLLAFNWNIQIQVEFALDMFFAKIIAYLFLKILIDFKLHSSASYYIVTYAALWAYLHTKAL